MTFVRRTLVAACLVLLATTAGRVEPPADTWQPTSGGAPPAPATPLPNPSAATAAPRDPFAPQPADGSWGLPQPSSAPAATTPEAALSQVQTASTSSRLKRLPKIGHMPRAHERIARTPAQPLPLEGQFEHVVTTFDPESVLGPRGPDFTPPYPGKRLWDDVTANNVRWWAHVEYLGWRMRGHDVPVLVTQSPPGTPLADAGVLGEPTTEVLFGGDRLNDGNRDGGRIRLGWWSVDGQFVGWQGEYFGFTRDGDDFSASCTADGPILARPFFNTALGEQDASLLCGTGLNLGGFTFDVDGSISVNSQSDLHNIGVIRRHVLWADFERNFRIDWLVGYRYLRLDEDLTITDMVTLNNPSGGLIPAGTQIRRVDQFNTTNDYHAGEAGLLYEVHRGRWALEGGTKMAIGNMHEAINAQGSQQINLGGTSGFAEVPGAGGFLVQPGQNAQHQGRNELALLTESELRLAFAFNDRWRAMLGCTVVYINRVTRPGTQIDPNLDPTSFPPAGGGNAPPMERFTESYLWLFGVNAGFEARW